MIDRAITSEHSLHILRSALKALLLRIFVLQQNKCPTHYVINYEIRLTALIKPLPTHFQQVPVTVQNNSLCIDPKRNGLYACCRGQHVFVFEMQFQC